MSTREQQRSTANYQKQAERQGTCGPYQPSEGTSHMDTLLMDLKSPELQDNTFLFKTPTLWYIVKVTIANKYSLYDLVSHFNKSLIKCHLLNVVFSH